MRGGRRRSNREEDETGGGEGGRSMWKEEKGGGARRKIGHIIHKSDLRTSFRCSLSIYSLTSINTCT